MAHVTRVDSTEMTAKDGGDFSIAFSEVFIDNGDVIAASSKSTSGLEAELSELDDQIEKSDTVEVEASEQDLSGLLKLNADIEDQVTGQNDQERKLDAVNEEVGENLSEGGTAEMNLADDYPPLVSASSSEYGDGSQVSSLNSLDKSWMEVATSKPTGFDVKAKRRVPKPSVISNSTVSRRKQVLNSFDVISEKEEAVTKTFSFLMKVPRCDDISLQEQINLAKLQVDEKTKLRDAIQVQIQEKRANSQIHGLDYEYAKAEDRKARRLVRSKHMETNSLLSVLSKAKTALSIEDINRQMQQMEYVMQHETLDLKKEKKLIREIKQLKQRREELLATTGSQDEIKQALEQGDEAEDRLKILRKEIDILKANVLRTEAAGLEAEKKYDDENRELGQLQAKCRAANDVRQSAYVLWQSLRKKLSVKNKHFFQYKDDAATANSYAFRGNKLALHHLCTNQVENLMQLWNTNDEFRQDYVKFNARSTVRRLGTLDGRSLSPTEKPPVLPSPHKIVAMKMMSATTPVPTTELKQNESTAEKLTEPNIQKVTNKEPEEDIQLTEKADYMLKKEEFEDKAKEQLRLEELEKAEVAREMKERQVEEEQTRAELKQKEEEEKEKTRLKRLRKKERKKANKAKAKAEAEAAMDVDDINENYVTAAETVKEDLELPKQPQMQLTSTVSAVPPSLRNRSWSSYRLMWTGLLICVSVTCYPFVA